MKYVIFNNLHPVIFSEAISHNDMKRLRANNCSEDGNPVITSAGFYKPIDDGSDKMMVCGRSETLNIGPSDKDLQLIEMFLKMS